MIQLFSIIIVQRTAITFLVVTLLLAFCASYATIEYDACLNACFQARTITAPFGTNLLAIITRKTAAVLITIMLFLALGFPNTCRSRGGSSVRSACCSHRGCDRGIIRLEISTRGSPALTSEKFFC